MADYKNEEMTWQGFLRPYRDGAEARQVFEKYITGVKKDGAEVRSLKAEGADEIVISNNIGLVDVVFRKGNTLAEPTVPQAHPLLKRLRGNWLSAYLPRCRRSRVEIDQIHLTEDKRLPPLNFTQ